MLINVAHHLAAVLAMTTDQELFRNYHEREAVRLRSLIATATTPALKARLLKEAENHEELAEEVEDLKAAAVS